MSAETIVAIATGAARAAVGILRLSGPKALEIARRIAGDLPPPRSASLRRFRDGEGAILDRGLVLAFPAPHSFTGEDVVELHAHGGPILLDALLRAACALGARPARPGEFSERAFLNGRLDLAQAEAIADLIEADSVSAAKAAARSLEGALSQEVHALQRELTGLRVYVEGGLDFSDEDIAWLAEPKLEQRMRALDRQLRELLAQAAQGRRLREGLVLAIAGQPNVGKSTLLNRLAGTEAAIVSEIAGTTRDVLREHLVLDGLPLTVVDMAGLRETQDPVEREGVRRAWAALERAELVLFLIDDQAGLTRADEALLERLPCGPQVLLLFNKCDLSGRTPTREASASRTALRISAQTGAGLELLKSEIRRVAGLGATTEGLFSARSRHVAALQRTQAHVVEAGRRLRERAGPELAAEELRLAQRALGEVTGELHSDDLLGEIFSRFCIGK